MVRTLPLQPGQKVRLRSTGEVGIVVWLWQNESQDTDVYVAVLGDKFPETEYPQDHSPTKPYLLKYYATSLEPIE